MCKAPFSFNTHTHTHTHTHTPAPSDYAALVDTSVTIEGSSATVLVVIVSDGAGEGDEQFTVRLSLPDMFIPRVELGPRTTATVVIVTGENICTMCLCVSQYEEFKTVCLLPLHQQSIEHCVCLYNYILYIAEIASENKPMGIIIVLVNRIMCCSELFCRGG